MPMTADELDELCAEIEGYFPTVSARLTRAPKLLALWRRTLQPFSAPLVLDAIARAASKNSHALELHDLLASINSLTEERQQRLADQPHMPSKQNLATTPKRSRSRVAADRLIAKLHCETVYRGLNLSNSDAQQKAAAQWHEWAATYPAIRDHCLEQAAACSQRVKALLETTTSRCLSPEMNDGTVGAKPNQHG